ncbi:MAG: trehalose-6-phosphate synthase [Crocinitomicaceae bacterium]|nr:trehalose-6-phosphate synthase [Crocinitomicaceae bacterium]
MRLNFALIISIVIAVGLVALGFTIYQISVERDKLNKDLEIHTADIADEFSQNNLPSITGQNNPKKLEQFIDSISDHYNLTGIALYYGKDSIIATNSLDPLIQYSSNYITQSLAADTMLGNYIKVNNRTIFQYIKPLQKDEVPNAAIIFYADAEYIDSIINSIWFRNFLRWFIQAFIVSSLTVVIIRWGIYSPISKIVDWVKAARVGNAEHLNQSPPAMFLAPLHREIIHIAKAMHEAKASAEEEAKLRSNAEAIWTPDRLKIEVENLLQSKKMVVVSNREPYMHIHEGKNITCIIPASGMITAMEPVLQACGGLWIASGTGDADKETVDKNDKLQVPPDEPKYTLRRMWQTKEEENHFYYGFSNEGLWPLCHIAHTGQHLEKQTGIITKK